MVLMLHGSNTYILVNYARVNKGCKVQRLKRSFEGYKILGELTLIVIACA